ncbi:MAG: hypothetical protein JEY99_19950 [Spirochaetales bacterium]|nr:hypothetical protein [Spirochaetales bacterium]
MALKKGSFFFQALGCKADFQIWLPEGSGDHYPSIYLHHGLGDNHQTPWKRTALENYLQGSNTE